jgi:hypothetical protein
MPHHSSAPPESADGLLDRADTLSWGNRWADAQPLYRKAQDQFVSQHRFSKALYAQVTIAADHSEVRREHRTASVTYVFADHVANEALSVNPLGLTIVRFRTDQAFS